MFEIETLDVGTSVAVQGYGITQSVRITFIYPSSNCASVILTQEQVQLLRKELKKYVNKQKKE